MAARPAVAILSEHEFFAGLPRAELERLTLTGRERRYAARDAVFSKGDPGDALYLVRSGSVQISTTSFEGKRITLNLLEQNRLFGEIALLDGGPRTADAIAWSDSVLLRIDRRPVLDAMEREPRFALRIVELLCERLRWTSEAVEDAMFMQLPQRLAKRLLLLAERFGRHSDEGMLIDLDISQEDLGTFAGVSRESVNKQLNLWRATGVIAIEGGHIILRQSEVLEYLADSG